jgi:hypothetical protein
MRALGPDFIFCAPGHIFGSNEGIGSRSHVWRAQPHFRRCRVRRVPFSWFSRPFSFSAIPRAWGPVFMFCALDLIFGGTEGVGFRFHVSHARSCFQRYRGHGLPFTFLRARTHFRQFRGRRFPFSCIARPYLCSTVPRASGPVLMFCAHELIFGGNEGD